jgi:hypothetical protein
MDGAINLLAIRIEALVLETGAAKARDFR